QAAQAGQLLAGVVSQLAHAGADGLQAQGGLEVDGLGDGQPGAAVAGALELQPAQPGGAAVLVGLVGGPALVAPAPGDLERAEAVDVAHADVEEAGPGGGEEPLVAVAPVEVAGDLGEVQVQEGGGVGAVDDGEDAALLRLGAQLAGGQPQAGGGEDVAEEEQPGALGHGLCGGVDDLGGILGQGGQGESADGQPEAPSGALPAPVHGAVLVVGEQDLAGGGEPERRGDEV